MKKTQFFRFIFQESLIWEGSANNLDPNGEVVLINAKSEARARKRLPKTGLGRRWILVDSEPK